ncbi:unnamed protein product [Auanema sp. JU1783]|nr:unnamed protein product [Auanema sp. JU1783]
MRIWQASLFFYVFVFVICEFLRTLVLRFIPGPNNRLSKQLLLEFIGTLQICAPMFDVGTILDNYGLIGVFVEITVLEYANSLFIRDCIAQPCPIITSCYRKWKFIKRVVYVFIVQFAAAYLSYFLARTFWRLHIHKVHIELLEQRSCTADLTVALTTGMLVEGFATFFAKAFEKWTDDVYEGSRTCALLNSTFSGLLCAIGINYTGMYANPIVAWACTFNCEGVSHLGHLIVYWFSPIVAWYLAEKVFGHEETIEEESEVMVEKKEK